MGLISVMRNRGCLNAYDCGLNIVGCNSYRNYWRRVDMVLMNYSRGLSEVLLQSYLVRSGTSHFICAVLMRS